MRAFLNNFIKLDDPKKYTIEKIIILIVTLPMR